jgi:hypothetical protein
MKQFSLPPADKAAIVAEYQRRKSNSSTGWSAARQAERVWMVYGVQVSAVTVLAWVAKHGETSGADRITDIGAATK